MKTHSFDFKVKNMWAGNADIYEEDDGIYLANLYIHPQYRNQGVATKVLERLIKGYGVNTLVVAKDNEIAIKLYNKFGFVVKKEYFSDELKTDVYYMKRVGEK